MNIPAILFKQYALEWLSNKQYSISPTHFNYCHILTKYIVPYFGNYQIKEITSEQIEMYLYFLRQKCLSETTLCHHYAILNQLFRLGTIKGVLEENPIDTIEKPKRYGKCLEPLNETEALELWVASVGHKLELVIKLALFFGLRRSEILGLRWKDIDFGNHTLCIRNAVVMNEENGKRVPTDRPVLKTKSSNRTLPICPALIYLLKQELAIKQRFGNPHICTDQKGMLIKPDEVTRAFRQFLKSQKFRHIRFHDLRHTCAGLLISKHTPLLEVQQWLGHGSIQTTANFYAHLDFSMKLENMNTMQKIFTE